MNDYYYSSLYTSGPPRCIGGSFSAIQNYYFEWALQYTACYQTHGNGD